MRHKLTRDEQIRGLRKALKNPLTPRQFRKGMERRLEKLERERYGKVRGQK